MVLVGTKKDLREDAETLKELQAQGQQPVSAKDAKKLASEIGARTYIECSAMTQENIKSEPCLACPGPRPARG
jgi:Ras-related C3 botulinum toxin substrate 1